MHNGQTQTLRKASVGAAYTPAPSAIKHLNQVTLVAVVGPSCVGKTTILRAALAADDGLNWALVDTSRAPRPGEQEGVDYRFCSKEAMMDRVARGAYVNVAPSTNGDLYATSPESFSRGELAVMAIWADAMPVFRSLPFKQIRTIFILPPNFDVWQQRMQERNFSSSQYVSRREEAARSLAFACADPETSFVVNDDLETATDDFLALAHGKRFTATQQMQQRQGPLLAAQLLAALGKT